MAQVKDAETLILGTCVAVEFLRDFDTKKQDGTAKVTLVTTDGGFAIVKLEADEVQQVKPGSGTRVAWVIRNAPWSMEGGRSGMSSRFVRVVDAGDIEHLLSITSAVEAAAA